jgi:hypothetical protein
VANDDVKPGEYLVSCSNAWIEQYKDLWRCVLQFVICDGKHDGVGVRKFKNFDKSGELPPESEFARACGIALKRPLNDDDDDLMDPASIFAHKKFVVFIGYRKTPNATGGQPGDELAFKKKDPGDRLRVHEIKSLVEV